jgi:hypothetical protein
MNKHDNKDYEEKSIYPEAGVMKQRKKRNEGRR